MWVAFGTLTLLSCATSVARDPYEAPRRELVDALAAQGISDSATLAAMREVPRHEFVPEELRQYAYVNAPLPIGHEQTISQPYIVAVMTQTIRPRPGLRVLEIGTGSGYQAAVLARTGCRVHSIEIVAALAEGARGTLTRLGYDSVQVRHGDGYLGWPEAAPFDAILVTAAPEQVPEPLIAQLAPGGRLVAPVGGEHAGQDLVLIEKAMDGTIRQRELLPVRFVPMRRAPDTTR
jgi:protein-L-isoaspartate(D-aspartate) O-methyltransferase